MRPRCVRGLTDEDIGRDNKLNSKDEGPIRLLGAEGLSPLSARWSCVEHGAPDLGGRSDMLGE